MWEYLSRFFQTYVSLLSKVPWLWVTIGCNAVMYLLDIVLEIRQNMYTRKFMRNPKSLSLLPLTYHRAESMCGVILESFALYFKVLVFAWNCSNETLDSYGFNETFQLTRGIYYLFMVSFFSSLVRAPFELYRILFLEPYKENSLWKTLIQLAKDQIKMFLVSTLLGIPLMSALLSLLYWDFPFHWLLASFFISGLGLALSDLYPLVLAPLFNTYTRLQDGNLRDRIKVLFKELNFPISEIYVMDSSQRVTDCNAIFRGIWTTDIVLYDNLTEKFSIPEIIALLGHEIGHQKNMHPHKHLLIQLVFIGNFVFLFKQVVSLPSFYTSFGFEVPDAAVGLVLFSYLYSTFANFLNFITHFIRYRFEFVADQFAIDKGLDIRAALVTLSPLVNQPIHQPRDWLYQLFHYHHPTISKRLELIDAYQNEKNIQSQDQIKQQNNEITKDSEEIKQDIRKRISLFQNDKS